MRTFFSSSVSIFSVLMLSLVGCAPESESEEQRIGSWTDDSTSRCGNFRKELDSLDLFGA
jgi:hypothetical protein